MKRDIATQRARIAAKTVKIKQFKDKLYQAIQFIQNEEELKKQAKALYSKFVRETVATAKVDKEIED